MSKRKKYYEKKNNLVKINVNDKSADEVFDEVNKIINNKKTK